MDLDPKNKIINALTTSTLITNVKYKHKDIVDKLQELIKFMTHVHKSKNNIKTFDEKFVSQMQIKTDDLVNFLKGLNLGIMSQVSDINNNYKNNLNTITQNLLLNGFLPNYYDITSDKYIYNMNDHYHETLHFILKLNEFMLSNIETTNITKLKDKLINDDIAQIVILNFNENIKIINEIRNILILNIKHIDGIYNKINISKVNPTFDTELTFVKNNFYNNQPTIDLLINNHELNEKEIDVAYYNDTDNSINSIFELLKTKNAKFNQISKTIEDHYDIKAMTQIMMPHQHQHGGKNIENHQKNKKMIDNKIYDICVALQNLNNLVEIFVNINETMSKQLEMYIYYQVYVVASLLNVNKLSYVHINYDKLKYYERILINVKQQINNVNNDERITFLKKYHTIIINLLCDFLTKLNLYIETNNKKMIHIDILKCNGSTSHYLLILNNFKDILESYNVTYKVI